MNQQLDPDALMPAAQYPTMTAAQVAEFADRILLLSEGINGPNQFSQESAAYGYIERHFRLAIPPSMGPMLARLSTASNRDDFNPANYMNPIQQISITYWNWLRLKAGNVNVDHAFFIAAYRARLIYLGYLYPERTGRAVTIDEVDWPTEMIDHHVNDYVGPLAAITEVGRRGEAGYVPPVAAREASAYYTAYNQARNNIGKLRAYMQHGTDNVFKRFMSYALSPERGAVMKHISLCAQQYAAMTYLVFRQHGHHYKTEFDAKYTVLWRATTLDSSPMHPGHELLHRAAIHSFGIKTLHVKFFLYLGKGKLADTFIDRQDVAPAGTAIIATCFAAIDLMKSLPIWSQIKESYGDQINILEGQAKLLKNAEDAIKYHKNARLFGVQRFQFDTTTAQALAPIAKGFIEALGSDADLGKQKALDKRAQQNPLMASLVEDVINRVTRKIARTGDISIFAKKLETTANKLAGPAAAIEGTIGPVGETVMVEEEESDGTESEEGEEGG
jgi:hypothetical protein